MGKKGMKKKVTKSITLNMFQRRVTLFAISQMSDDENPQRGGKHGAKAMVIRNELSKTFDAPTVDDWFIDLEEERQKRIRDPTDPRNTVTIEERAGEDETYKIMASYYKWARKKIENGHFYGLMPDEVVSTLEAWEIDTEKLAYDDSDWVDDDADVEGMENVEKPKVEA